MKIKGIVFSTTLLLGASLAPRVSAATFDFTFAGSGVNGTVELTYGTVTDSKVSQGFEVTGISGTFSDSNNGLNIVNAPIVSLVSINHAAPDLTNKLAPADFSKFPVATGLGPESNGVLTYDNLYYPGGAPATATDYQATGGFVDIYGLLFSIGNGIVVDFWSNGTFDPTVTNPNDYGVGVATAGSALDYVSGDVSQTPEPGTLALIGAGVLGMLAWRRRASRKASL